MSYQIRDDEQFSPHAWGWTGSAFAFYAAGAVLPTRVGVDHGERVPAQWPRRSPHTRGGGPLDGKNDMTRQSSPHTRGGGPAITWSTVQ